MSDTFLKANEPNTAKGSVVTCQVDGDAGSEKWQALRWDVSAIPSGSVIDEVTVTVEVTNKTGSSGYYAYPLSRAWSEANATWNHYDSALAWQVAGASGALDRESTPVALWAPEVTGTHTLSLNPDLVQTWLDFPALNYGILLANEDNTNGLDFHSGEATTASERPKLTVVYH
nr:DNRLRE domain-containing protein [Pseudenhygromyxa sp. WMMC2535]